VVEAGDSSQSLLRLCGVTGSTCQKAGRYEGYLPLGSYTRICCVHRIAMRRS
jgi:hypothetical protein